MTPADTPHQPPDDIEIHPSVQCDACASALQAPGDRAVSFLLIDQLTVPLIGCENHLEQFASVCGLSTEDTADLLDHQPAGGIRCPSCRLAPRNPDQPVIAVQDGAVAVLACPEHQTEMVNRFQTGIDTHQQLTASIDTG